MNIKKIFWCFFTAILVWGEISLAHSEPANVRVNYGKDELQYAELRLPSGPGPFPVVILIHGGCWMSAKGSLQFMSPFAEALQNLDIAIFNIEYRGINIPGGGWPGTLDDIAEATNYLPTLAQQYPLDLQRVIVIGHSAGGHLALWLAGQKNLQIKLKGVIDLAGVPDLKIFREQAIKVCGDDVIGKLLGNSADSINKHYQQASPIELLPLGVPQILVYGQDDSLVPVDFVRPYQQQALKKGDSAQLIIIENTDHAEPIIPNSIAWPQVKSAVLELLAIP